MSVFSDQIRSSFGRGTRDRVITRWLVGEERFECSASLGGSTQFTQGPTVFVS